MSNTAYRTHTLHELRTSHVGQSVTLCGFVSKIRDHGKLIFIDLRDHYGVTQIVITDNNMMEQVTKECNVQIQGSVVLRSADRIHPTLKTGKIEVLCEELIVLCPCKPLPFEVAESKETKEDLRLQYRFLDLRNAAVHKNIVRRSEIIAYIRNQMISHGFLEIQTPILTSSSPEGARDFIIPSRKHPGKFYALPQAPQIFKQLLMVCGFDRYFQIAPCFRDEDAKADRTPGEFYQLDFEMAYAKQEDVLLLAEDVLYHTFKTFSSFDVSKPPFVRIPFREAMLKYGTDKPDLRNPLLIEDISDLFADSNFQAFRGKTVRVICVENAQGASKGFFEKIGKYALEIGMKGLGYIKISETGDFTGPIGKFLSDDDKKILTKRLHLKPNAVLFFIADLPEQATKFAGLLRMELAKRFNLMETNAYRFCYVVDFPMYQKNEESGQIEFTHNPFSMPQGEMAALTEKNPLDILAYQYDIVCNGIELSSGAVRNHRADIMEKAFEIAGYLKEHIEQNFPALYKAFQYGAPPHAGMAPGIDRIVMLLCEEESIRDVIAFPLTSTAQDLLMNAPCEVTKEQLNDVHIKIK